MALSAGLWSCGTLNDGFGDGVGVGVGDGVGVSVVRVGVGAGRAGVGAGAGVDGRVRVGVGVGRGGVLDTLGVGVLDALGDGDTVSADAVAAPTSIAAVNAVTVPMRAAREPAITEAPQVVRTVGERFAVPLSLGTAGGDTHRKVRLHSQSAERRGEHGTPTEDC